MPEQREQQPGEKCDNCHFLYHCGMWCEVLDKYNQDPEGWCSSYLVQYSEETDGKD